MKRALLVMFAVCLLVVLGIPVLALEGNTVLCQGTKCGGSGIRDYQYEVICDPEIRFQWLGIATCDGNPANYRNILTPAGWVFSGPVRVYDDVLPHAIYSPHGSDAGPYGYCKYQLRWSYVGDGVWDPPNRAVFGFDNLNAPHDAHWITNNTNYGASADWIYPVGMGDGLIHSPVAAPEPGSALVLGSGLMGLVAALRRRR